MADGYTFRDRVVCTVCNWLLTHVASERYRKMIGGSIRYGLMAAARDSQLVCTPEVCAYDNFCCPNGCLESVEADA